MKYRRPEYIDVSLNWPGKTHVIFSMSFLCDIHIYHQQAENTVPFMPVFTSDKLQQSTSESELIMILHKHCDIKLIPTLKCPFYTSLPKHIPTEYRSNMQIPD